MFYFNTLPKVITPDQNGDYIVLTNIMSRASLMEELQDNPMLFYKYTLQEGDTPEIVAEKYYGDPYDYWIVLHSNQILDPLWDWPLSDTNFNNYINEKYSAVALAEDQTPYEYTNTTVYGYKKIVTTTDSETGISTEKFTFILKSEYDSLVESTNTFTVGGKTCTIRTTKQSITLYDYEYGLNESKREIKIMDKAYAGQMKIQLKTLMGA